MPAFCTHCGTALSPTAKFCPSCGGRVGVAAALASEVRAGVQSGVRSIAKAPSMRVPALIWAGVIEVFWIARSTELALLSFVLALGGSVAVWASEIFGQQAAAERVAVWSLAAHYFYLGQLSLQIPLALGFFTMKRWTYGLYLWTIVPLTITDFALYLTMPADAQRERQLPLSVEILETIGGIVALGLIVVQVMLVVKSKDSLIAAADVAAGRPEADASTIRPAAAAVPVGPAASTASPVGAAEVADLSQQASLGAPAERRCPNCAAVVLEPDSIFCTDCGVRLSPAGTMGLS